MSEGRTGDPTKAQVLLGRVIDNLNQLVLAAPLEDAHRLIEIARKHLDARYYQTRPVDSAMPEPDYECTQQSVLPQFQPTNLDEEVI